MLSNMSCSGSARMPVVELLGEKLKNKDHEEIATESITGNAKFVGLYFSGHWCAPCRSFTPKLISFYNNFKKRESSFEIVFISSDETEDQFNEYYSEMPWLALPYNRRDIKRELHIQYKVKGIPLLLILDSVTGEVVCKNAGNELKTDPEGKKFPWKLRPLSDILAGNVIDNEMKTLSLDNLKGKVLGIYFSAHWCPPCKTFTPVLKGTYEKIKETGQPFEIIFATKDQKEDSFKSYFAEMPWLAFPFQDERIEELSKSLSVLGIPMLVIIDAEGKLITTEGRGSVMQDPEGKNFPWYPPACCELDSFSASIVNEGPCLILFTEIEEGDDDEYSRKALEMMKPVAEEIRAAEEAKGKEPACKFIVAGDDDMVESLQQFLSIADESLPMLALLNIPREQVSCCEGKEITPDLIREYYHKFVSDELEWTSLS